MVFFINTYIGFRGMVLIAFTFVSILLMLIGATKWKLSLYFFLLWFILEGIFRKWIAPEYSTSLFFVKYGILLGPFIHFISKGIKISKKEYPFYWIILLYLFWGLLEVLNPRLTTDLRVKILGLMIHFSFIPLIYVIPKLLNNKSAIINLFKSIVIVSIPIFILGVYQYYSSPDSEINTYVAQDAFRARVGEHVRITGVFSYITPYTSYLTFSMVIIIAVFLMGGNSLFINLLLISAASLGIVNIIMTGSRGAFLSTVLIALGFFLFYFKDGIKNKKKEFMAFILMLVLSICVVSFTDIGKDSFSSFQQRARTSGGIGDRLVDIFTPYKYFSSAGMVGFGIGTTYQGSGRFISDFKDMPTTFEEETERIFLEIGLIGFMILFILRIVLLLYTYRVLKKFKG